MRDHRNMDHWANRTKGSWLDQIFAAKAVQKGGVIRRSKTWVAREIGTERFIAEVRHRGFHLLECGPQYVILCSRAPVRILV